MFSLQLFKAARSLSHRTAAQLSINRHKRFIQFSNSANMPLVVPGINSGPTENNKTNEWMNKLVGKTIGETSDSTTFAKGHLPKETRVIQPGQMVTKDLNEERLNVYMNDKGEVSRVGFG